MNRLFERIRNSRIINKLDEIRPSTVLLCMMNNFSLQPSKSAVVAPSVFNELINAKSVDKFSDCSYELHAPQNKVLTFGIMFNNLYNIYMQHLNLRSIKHPSTPNLSLKTYKNMPKRYRSVFVKYDNKYVLNISESNAVIAPNKHHIKELIKLLERAKVLIPVIYQGQTSALSFFAAQFASTEQINAIKELCDIFIHISKITLPYAIPESDKNNSGAIINYDEYLDALTQKNCLLNAKRVDDKLKQLKEIKLKEGSKSIESYYNNVRKNSLDVLRLTISTHIR